MNSLTYPPRRNSLNAVALTNVKSLFVLGIIQSQKNIKNIISAPYWPAIAFNKRVLFTTLIRLFISA
jgi:hypothetical protein